MKKITLATILAFIFFSAVSTAQKLTSRVGETKIANTISTQKSITAKSSAAVAVTAAGSIDVAGNSTYNNYSADQLVRNVLTSGCLSISNVRFGYYKKNGSNWDWTNHIWSNTPGNRQLGYFSSGTSTFPLDEGIMLATGKISSAVGPNQNAGTSDDMVADARDPDLETISGQRIYDASVLEFDFIPDGNVVEFKFVFASEEYLEYVHTAYNDAFGFFLSGYGINGSYRNNAVNLAKLTNGDAVTINNIHSSGTNVNSQSFPDHNVAYYVNNPSGSTTMEYDGSTVVLTATYNVTAGQNYKIKMAIGDASDQKWDAGVFLKARSFETNTLLVNNPAHLCFPSTTANLTAAAVTAGSTAGLTYTYWSDANATVPFNTPTQAPAGTYYIKGKKNDSGCSSIKPVTVTSSNITAVTTKTNVSCNGGSNGTASVTPSGGTGPYTYSWSPSGGTGASATGLPAGTYTVTITDAKSCSIDKIITIGQPATPMALGDSSKTDATCFGGKGTVTAGAVSGGIGTVTYSWTNSANSVVGTTASISDLVAGTYKVTVTDQCSTQYNTVTIGQPNAAMTLGNSSKTDATCFGGKGTVTAGAVSGGIGTVTYSWTNSANSVVGTTASISDLVAGTYKVTVTDQCSTQYNTVTIGQPNAAMTLGNSSKTDATCFGGKGTVTAGAVSGGVGTVTYSWTNSANTVVGTTASVSDLVAGTYKVTVTDQCSTKFNTVTIGQPNAAMALGNSSKTDATCFGGKGTVTAGAVSGGIGTVTYSWTNSANAVVGTTASVSDLVAGTYKVTVTDQCSSQFNTVTIGQPNAAMALGDSSKTDATCFGGKGTVTAGAITGSIGTVTYSWTNSANAVVGTTASVSDLVAGTYKVTVTDQCSSQFNTVTIGQPNAAMALGDSSKTDATCFGGKGTVTAGTVSGSIGTVTYSWTNGANTVVGTTASVSDLVAGTYKVTVTDQCSSQYNTVTIGQPNAAMALGDSSKTDATCFGGKGTVTAGAITGSIGTVTYSWTNSANTVVGTTASVSDLVAGTYKVTVTDQCSTQYNTVTIGQPATPMALGDSSKTDATCFGGKGTVTAGAVSGGIGTVTYSWTNSANTVVGTTASVSDLVAGTYKLTVTDQCSTQYNTVTIGQPNAALALGDSSKTDATCFGGKGTVTAGAVSGGIGTITYSWTNSANTVVGTTASVSDLVAGTYKVTVTDQCSTQFNTVTIGQPNAAMALGDSSKTDATCFGGKGTVTAGAITGSIGTVTYSWTNSANTVVGTTASVSDLVAGTYKVTVTDQCSTQYNTVTIGQPNAAMALGDSSKTDATCFGGKGTVTAGAVSGGIGTITYSWTNSANTVVGTTASVSDLVAGTYKVTVTDQCSTQYNTVTIGQPNAAMALGDSSKTDATCFGGKGTVTAGAVSGGIGTITYSWTNSANTVVGTTASVSDLVAGTYKVTVTDQCSTQFNTVTIGQPNAAMALGDSSKTDATCFGGKGTVTAGAVSGGIGTVTYSWTNSANTVVGTTASVSDLVAGTYKLTVTDQCSTQYNTVTIGQPNAALALGDSSKTDATCFGGKGTVTAGAVSGGIGTVTYSWTNSANTVVGTTASVSDLVAGTYKLTVTDQCSTQYNTVTIGQPNAALALGDSSKTDATCFGGKGTVTAGAVSGGIGTVTYSWTNSANTVVGTTASVSDLVAGTYKVTVTDQCSTKFNTVTIGQPNAELTATKSQVNVGCGGDNTGSATVVVSGGTLDYSYSWSPSGGSEATASNLSAGDYTVTITDKNGCNIIKSFTIEDGDAIIPIINPLPQPKTISCPAEPQFAQASASDLNGTISVLEYNDLRTEGDCPGTYSITRTWNAEDACGNKAIPVSQTITIQDTTAPTWTTEVASLNTTIECSNAEALQNAQNQVPTAIDACDSNLINIQKIAGEFVASQNCANAGSYTNTWTVTDNCGNTSETFTQVITIQDTNAPTWTTEVASLNTTIECSNAEALENAQNQVPTAIDACDSNLTNIQKIAGEFVASQDCAHAGSYTNTWTVTDNCGNTSETFTQVITIQDTNAPTWTTEVASLNTTIECSNAEALENAQNQVPTAIDACDSNLTNIQKIAGEFVASQDCAHAGSYTNTWTVTDNCGNTSETFTQVITIQDTTAPTWTTEVASLNTTVECSNAEALEIAQNQVPTAIDACDSNLINIQKIAGEFVASQDCANAGSYTNTWTVTDNCGNTSETFTQVITIQDTTAPTWAVIVPTDITVSCDNVPEAVTMTVSDSCGQNSTVSYTESKSGIEGECNSNYILTRIWTATDCSNNSISHTQIVTVRDTTAPTGTAPQSVTDLQSISDIPEQNASLITDATDNCSEDVTITISDSNKGGSGCDGNNFILTRTYTLSDCAGNTSELTQTFTVQNNVFVSGVATNASCFGESDGSILVTNSPDATVIITNENNEVVGSTNLPAGTYTLTASSSVGNSETCSATAIVTITQPNYRVRIEGTVINKETNNPIANVPITLVPQGSTPGSILLKVTGSDGKYNFTDVVAGAYLVQVQDANLNSAHQLYPVNSSLYFTTLEECVYQIHDFEYEKSDLPVLGDFVWYDANNNGIQDEWVDANDDGLVTKNIPDANGSIDFTQWEWIDYNGDGSYDGPQNIGELNAAGFGNAQSSNIFITGPNGYSDTVIVGIQGYWRNRPDGENPWGAYTIELKMDSYLENASLAMAATGLVKTLPSTTIKKVATTKNSKNQSFTVCGITDQNPKTVNLTPEERVRLDVDFGVSCKLFATIIALDDNAGPVDGLNGATNVLNVFSNDTFNDSAVNPSDVVLSVVTPNEEGVLVLNADGSVDVKDGTPEGTYNLVYQICETANPENCDSATVTVSTFCKATKVSGIVFNSNTNTPLKNVPVNLIPQGDTPGEIQIRLTNAEGYYNFVGFVPGNYLVQVQDANLNSAQELYPDNSSLFFTTIENCAYQTHDFSYGKSTLPVLGDYVWYDVNNNGKQDEWYDANGDGLVTQNLPDVNGAFDYSQWEWIDYNEDGSYEGPENNGELNAGGFGNTKSSNIFITGPNGYSDSVIIGIQGFWRNRPDGENPFGDYKVELVRDANFDAASEALGATGLVKTLPGVTLKKVNPKTSKMNYHTVCSSTSDTSIIVTITPEDLVHTDADFGVSCKTVSDIVAVDDNAGIIVGVDQITANVINVLANDNLNELAVTVDNVIVTTVSPNEYLQLNADGSLDVLPNAPTGEQTLTYQICELDDTSSCATAIATVTIETPTMKVIANGTCINDVPYLEYSVTPDNFTPVEGLTIVWKDGNNDIISTMSNIALSGRVLWPGAVVDANGNGTDWPGWIFKDGQWIQTNDGFEGLRPTATLTFSVNPEQTVVVNYPPSDPFCTARPKFTIEANDDIVGPIGSTTGATNTGNVLTNDTLNTLEVVASEVDITTISTDSNGNITINPDGSIDVKANTPAGTYTVTYQICEKADSGNCDQATVTINVVENGTITIEQEACNEDSSVLNLDSFLPNGTQTGGNWIDQNNSGALEGSTFNALGLKLGLYILEYQIVDGENFTKSILINMDVNDDCKVLPAPPICGDVIVHNAFSPNGDNINDYFVIDNIDKTTCYPENTVEIYNRWGILVFETKNYNNTSNAFDGTSRGRTTVNKTDGLPTGTYFYIVNYTTVNATGETTAKKLDGYLYLTK